MCEKQWFYLDYVFEKLTQKIVNFLPSIHILASVTGWIYYSHCPFEIVIVLLNFDALLKHIHSNEVQIAQTIYNIYDIFFISKLVFTIWKIAFTTKIFTTKSSQQTLYKVSVLAQTDRIWDWTSFNFQTYMYVKLSKVISKVPRNDLLVYFSDLEILYTSTRL